MSRARVWIDAEPAPGWRNMAVDTAMLDRATTGDELLFRVYRWAPHCLSFGRHEPARRRYDLARIREIGIDCVRRPTGGRAVWHARELTYAIAAPTRWFGSPRSAYGEIHTWLAAAVARLGLATSLASAGRTPGPGAGPCFASAVGGELVAGGAKVLGSAQRDTGIAFLQHGSLLLEDDQSFARSLALASSTAPATEAPLARLLDRPVTWDEAAAAVLDELGARGLRRPTAAIPNDVAEAAALHYEHYRSDQWTWDR